MLGVGRAASWCCALQLASVASGGTPLNQTAGLGPQCSAYLADKRLGSPDDLAAIMRQQGLPCNADVSQQFLYHPNPAPQFPGVQDTSSLQCRYGNQPSPVCCGWRPHFNWIVATCEHAPGQGEGQFCNKLPACAKDGSPKINYVAAYQYNGSHFVMMDDSSVGDLSPEGIKGNFGAGTGWQSQKQNFRWRGGDWTTKYAPWARGNGVDGPRGVTPPGGLWVLSADNFYYGAFYMLSQLTLNLEGKGQPTGTNCWTWELDPVEGAAGWNPDHTPGNLNMLYSTNDAQVSGCMPVTYNADQAQGLKNEFSEPEHWRQYCGANPQAVGCNPWEAGRDVSWSGGAPGTQRFENDWDEPYVFAVVVDQQGYWIYRWRPNAKGGHTGWAGLDQYAAARVLPPRPEPVRDPKGLRSDVPGDAAEAVILQPSVLPEAACLRSSVETEGWDFGSDALAAMALELGQSGPGQKFEGTQNWWTNFADTAQDQGYPLSIAGVPMSEMNDQLPYTCNTPGQFGCRCRSHRRAPPPPPPGPPPPGPPPPGPAPAGCPVPPDNGGCCLHCEYNRFCPSNKGCYKDGQPGCNGSLCPAPPAAADAGDTTFV